MEDKYIHLQWVGEKKAIYASELKPGMSVMWNGGYISTVVSMEYTKSRKSINFLMKSGYSGEILPRRMSATKLVAVV